VKNWRKAAVPETATLRDAVETLDRAAAQIVLVAREDRLLGTITDGDVRRGLLRGVPLDSPVSAVMNERPQTVLASEGPAVALQRMRQLRIHQMPVLDGEGRLVDLLLLDDLVAAEEQEAVVVLMAGGLGTRLRPLTENTPKPLLNVGGKPLIETIVESFVAQGFRDIYLSVNYKAELFREHFGDGRRFGARIAYIDETEPRGTAGALALLPERPETPLIVMNGDLLTAVDYRSLLRFHMESQAAATMCVREYSVQVPYGVIEVEDNRLTRIVEKPTHSFFINAGIYALSPEALDLVPGEGFFDMPTLFGELVERGRTAAAFPIREYWLDIGRMEDLERARGEYDSIFG
jgi:dTDP-glucose pyrophosphorylase